MSNPSALLVSMPWTNTTEPSLGLGILKAILKQNGIPSRVAHMNIFLLKYLKSSTYNSLSYSYALHDFLFTYVLDPVVTSKQHALLREMIDLLVRGKIFNAAQYGGLENLYRAILRLRNETIPAWLKECADEIVQDESTLVGFTCMFDQTISSVALAKLVKEKNPGKLLVMGGYSIRNPTAEMIMRCYPWIDAICTGEGERTITGLANASVNAIALEAVPGILYRAAHGAIHRTPPAEATNLNENPTPDFDDFFSDTRRLSTESSVSIRPPVLPIENSRGCWWGEKSHCVFCGIKNSDLVYRAKLANHVVHSMNELHYKHGINAFRFSDYILPNEYFHSLIPELITAQAPYHISCEMKANITEDKFKMLAQAGFFEVQPGIESFHSNVLRKMKKGVTGIQNVFTLLLGKKYGVRILYNILYGFPSDEITDYEELYKLIPRLVHLDPPITYIEVKITRWAPLQTQPETFGIPKATVDHFYEMLFSPDYLEKTGFKLEDFCYYFERPYKNEERLTDLYLKIAYVMDHWQATQKPKWLYKKYNEKNEAVIYDKRFEAETVFNISEACDTLLNSCTQPKPLNALPEQCPHLSKDCIEEAVRQLDQLGLIMIDENKVLSLVLQK